jgi:hypothetical protein
MGRIYFFRCNMIRLLVEKTTMTTLAAIATKDALVMGCDSLGSVTMYFVNPARLYDFFDPDNGYKLKLDEHGTPVLKDLDTVYGMAEILPYNHMTHVDKLFSLRPLEMGVMVTGLASIADFTVKNLINQFKGQDKAFKQTGRKPANFTVKSVAERLLKFIYGFYDKAYKDWANKPVLELMIGGYDKQKHTPNIYRIHVHEKRIESMGDGFGVVFGGQMTEIQRLVFGTDSLNRIMLVDRARRLVAKYREQVLTALRENGVRFDIPEVQLKDYDIFSDGWSLQALDAEWGDFSERNAIECVKFFIDIMVKSQQFSNKLPTVGGDVHIAIITKTDGFKNVLFNETGVRYE